jgi:two-component system, OmpR family, phosphate regulon sensor histidine kinase PhoR
MRSKPLFWQIYPSYILIIVLAIVAVSGLHSRSRRNFYLGQVATELEVRARLFEDQVAHLLLANDNAALDTASKRLGRNTGTRFTVVLPSGRVVADSLEDPARMDNHANRPEIVSALRNLVGRDERPSRTIQEPMMYVALPVRDAAGQPIVGVVRAARSISEIDRELRASYRDMVVRGLLVVLAAGVLGYYLSRRLSRPLVMMKQGAERFAQGSFEQKLQIAGSREAGALARAMNVMAGQLDERIRTISQQRNEQQAVLTSMVEGVVALDNDERILHLNRAAADLLGLDAATVAGRRLEEVVRKADLQRFVGRALAGGGPLEGEVVLPGTEGDRFLQVHATLLLDGENHRIGVLIVLNDVTRLRRLENIRKDFVANVSHELKTPITGIKGAVETLQDGAMEREEDSTRFLGIIAKQADRLNAIIDDLLELSRIEQGEGTGTIILMMEPLAPVLRSAANACLNLAEGKDMRLSLACESELRARINAPLLEQALVNLIDNAIKYSDPGQEVFIEACRADGEVQIRVHDQGYGIAAEHLPRLFERFYRVDKARSRRVGGTGLGLSIVKHIVKAHHGRIEVASEVGQGSVFTVILPAC